MHMNTQFSRPSPLPTWSSLKHYAQSGESEHYPGKVLETGEPQVKIQQLSKTAVGAVVALADCSGGNAKHPASRAGAEQWKR
jgi:hypothetical protein